MFLRHANPLDNLDSTFEKRSDYTLRNILQISSQISVAVSHDFISVFTILFYWLKVVLPSSNLLWA